MTFSIGLLVSAHSAEASAGSSFNTAGALTGFLAFFGIIQFVYGESLPWKEPIMYFGLPWPPRRLLCMSVMALGLWALLGAKWRIGSDLREGRRFWRLPAFLAFLVFYQVGFEKINLYLSAIIPAFIAFFAATLNSERRDHWRRWLSGSGHWLHDIPTWIIACASYGILALLLVFIGKASGAETLFWRYPLLQTCFLVRDCAFMQVCRFTKIRRPEVTALILIGLAYLLSPIVLIGLAALLPPIVFNAAPIENPLRLTCLFAPLVLEDAGAFADFLSGLIQAAGALWLLSSSIRRQRLAQAYQEF
ncbi:MAG: hypothetical protein HY922_01660 [Elusimicrobia bacterium]|nr:hypothetical protein [Elusimicrobiota bacterium]